MALHPDGRGAGDLPRRRWAVIGVAAPFRLDGTWKFDASPTDLWTVLTRTDDYPTWWSWLREFEAEGLRAETMARCTIQSPFPYSLHCQIRIDTLQAPHLIMTTVSGDLQGPARLEIRPDGTGSSARLVWSVTLGNPVLVQMARFARPAMAWAHDRIVAIGADQFRRRALTELPPNVGPAPR